MDKKSSFLRMLWIPGTRKTHPKGHYGPTNKRISYTTKPKKSEVWSLGGSKLQKDLLKAESDTTLLDGPTNSGLVSVACVATTIGAVAAATTDGTSNADANANTNAATAAAISPSLSPSTAISVHPACSSQITPSELINSKALSSSASLSTSPTSPNSTASTAPLVSPTINPLDEALNQTDTINGICEVTELMKMPAKSHSLTPVIVTATTTAEIMDINRYTLINNNKEPLSSEGFDIYSLPSPPKTFLNGTSNGGNSLENGGTFEQISPSNSANQILEEQKRTLYFEKAMANYKKTPQNPQHDYHHHYPINNHSPRIHNNNQGDVNSIESINDDDDTTTISTKLYSSTTLPQHEKQQQQKFERQQQEQQQLKQDQQEQQQNVMPEHMILAKSKKKRKKKNGYTKDLDQLDGVAPKQNFNEDNKDDDEKVVKCLYYTLMCCDCTIS